MSGERVSPPPAAEALGLRELGGDDVAVLASFLARNDVPAVTSTFTPFPMSAETARSLLGQRHEDHYYGAFTAEGELVALSMLRGWDEGYEVPSFGIVVDARWHGRGVGSRMTEWTIERARELRSPRVRLTVYDDNAVARRMYLRLGFVEVERGPSPDDGGRERSVMVLELGS